MNNHPSKPRHIEKTMHPQTLRRNVEIYRKSCERYSALRAEANEVNRGSKAPGWATKLEREIADVGRSLAAMRESLEALFSQRREQAFRTAKERAIAGETGDIYEDELRKLGVPMLEPIPAY